MGAQRKRERRTRGELDELFLASSFFFFVAKLEPDPVSPLFDGHGLSFIESTKQSRRARRRCVRRPSEGFAFQPPLDIVYFRFEVSLLEAAAASKLFPLNLRLTEICA